MWRFSIVHNTPTLFFLCLFITLYQKCVLFISDYTFNYSVNMIVIVNMIVMSKGYERLLLTNTAVNTTNGPVSLMLCHHSKHKTLIRCWYNVGHCCRRWNNIEITRGQCLLVSPLIVPCIYHKWVKIIQIWQNGGQLFLNLAGWCHILSLTYLKCCT